MLYEKIELKKEKIISPVQVLLVHYLLNFCAFKCKLTKHSKKSENPLISQGISAFVPFSGTVMEAPPRIELGIRALQAPALPLGHGAVLSFCAVSVK